MPHLIIEYARDLLPEAQIMPLLQAVHQAAEQTQLFDSSHIKVRAVPVTHFLVGGEGRGFVHAQLRIKEGRDQKQKKHLSEQVQAALRQHLPGAFVITVEVVDMDNDTYAKSVL